MLGTSDFGGHGPLSPRLQLLASLLVGILVVKILTTLSLLLVFISAFRYVGAWLVSDAADNFLLLRTNLVLLPLRPLELERYGDATKPQLSPIEKKGSPHSSLGEEKNCFFQVWVGA